MRHHHGGSTAIGVDDDLAAGQAGIAIGTADDELARRVDIPLAIVSDLQLAQSLANIGFDDLTDLLRVPAGIEVLRGQNDGYGFRSLAVDVTNRHLALGIGAELRRFAFAALAGGGQQLQDAVRIIDRRRHQVRRFLASVTEHDALVASALVTLLVGGIIHALRDIGRLRMQQNVDLGGLPVETILFVADVADRLSGGGLELGRVDDRVAGGVMTTLPSLSFFRSVSGTRTSPAITTRLVVASVSHAMRTVHGSTPVLAASR